MKQDIHPKYHSDAKISCVCGNSWTVGSTLPEIKVNVCSKCHPLYTGTEKIVDTRGRVDKFNKRASKAGNKKSPKTK